MEGHEAQINLIDLANLSSIELLALHARIAEELRNRAIARTSNNPTGDLAEYLFCKVSAPGRIFSRPGPI